MYMHFFTTELYSAHVATTCTKTMYMYNLGKNKAIQYMYSVRVVCSYGKLFMGC